MLFRSEVNTKGQFFRASFGKNPRFQIQLDQRPLSPGTSRGGASQATVHHSRPAGGHRPIDLHPMPQSQVQGQFPKQKEAAKLGSYSSYSPSQEVGSPPVSGDGRMLFLTVAAAAAVASVVSDSVRPHRQQPTRLPVPGILRQEQWSGLPFPSPMHESEK